MNRCRGLVFSLVFTILAFANAQGMVVPALPAIAAEFAASETDATWVLSANLVTTALALPVVGRLGDKWGRRRVLLATLVLLVVGGVVAAIAPSLPWLIVGRAVQGIGGGVYPLCFGLARVFVRAEAQGRAVSMLSVGIGVGGAIGLPLGGLVLDESSHRWILWSNAATALVALVLIAVAVPPTTTVRPPARRWTATWLDAVGFGSRQIWLTNLVTALVGMGNFALMVMVTQIAQSGGGGLGMSATAAGLLLLPGSLVMIPAGVLAGTVARRLGNKVLLATGASLTIVGFALAAVWQGGAAALAVSASVVFAGVGFALAAASGLIVEMVSVGQTGAATGMNGLARLTGSALGAPIAVAVLAIGSPRPGAILASSAATAFAVFAIVMSLAVALVAGLPRRSAGPRV